MKTEDEKLRELLNPVVVNMQMWYRSKSRMPAASLYDSTDTRDKYLIRYCESMISANKPEWQVIAERAGWAPAQA
ncbi:MULTISPECIES: hypothetical protein [Ralstonia]|jgi:hypothetical protein|uniref:Uncharacterized protein n=2 Tax=Ralstonia pickettii TaxID=329 RepID=R0DWM7_RALPI|nr:MULTISPECIES: hypothetical protein [Ralstonia]ENZ77838.1 hypothetical protein OR214_02114 [Ralstonia pickettii OR214]MBL4777797.1 hypothetical protein [Ralstonia sp.]MCM3582063.1 hypothetical protein [Ralstonia pickettii]MDR9384649.1 hypothetical protein [Ralstonia sp. 11b]OCS50580.1 hypothetical protein BEK68_13970 [Ralstonia pickettii]